MVRGSLIESEAETMAQEDGKGGTWSFEAVRYDMNATDTGRFVSRSSGCFLLICGLVNVIILLSMTLEQVGSEHYALPYNTVTGRVKDEVKSEGLHAKPAYGQWILWPKTYETVGESLNCNSLDGVRLRLETNFQYLPRQSSLFDLTKTYGPELGEAKEGEGEQDNNFKTVLSWHSRSAIRNACAEFTTQEFQTQRSLVQSAIYDKLAARLASYLDTDVVDVQLTFIERPAGYEYEVDRKEAARNDIDKAENERAQALTQANTVLLEAQINANKTLDTARTTAANALTYAQAQADVITGRYVSLAETYLAVKTTHGMSNEALLTYVATRLQGDTVGATFGLDAPAKTSYIGDLS